MSAPLHILVVEDDALMRLTTCELLGKLGHTSVAVTNGREALDLLRVARFDVAVVDLNMPVMGGRETAAAVRRHPESRVRHLPLVAVSGANLSGTARACLAAGFDSFLHKPFHLRALGETIVRVSRRTGS